MRFVPSLVALLVFLLTIASSVFAIENKLISIVIGDEKSMASAQKAASMLILPYSSYKMGKYARTELDQDIYKIRLFSRICGLYKVLAVLQVYDIRPLVGI